MHSVVLFLSVVVLGLVLFWFWNIEQRFGSRQAGFLDLSGSTFRAWLESLGPRYVHSVVLPLRESARLKRHRFAYWVFTTANGMTMLGVILSAVAAVLVLGKDVHKFFAWSAFWMFLLSRAPDIMDGWIARHAPNGHESPLADSSSDKAGFLLVFLALYYVIKHPSATAWTYILILGGIDALNLILNVVHHYLGNPTSWLYKLLRGYILSRGGARQIAGDAADRVKQAAVNVMAKIGGKIKVWAMSFMAGALFMIVVFPDMRSHALWYFFWISGAITLLGALVSCAGKVKDLIQLISQPQGV